MLNISTYLLNPPYLHCLCATVLCTIIMVQMVRAVLTGWSTVSGFDLALCLPSASVSSVFMVLYKY